MSTGTAKRKDPAQGAHSLALAFAVDEGRRVSGLLEVPGQARAGYVLAHGAGAGMNHPFLDSVAKGLAARGIATLRYQFPYMEQRLRRPDTPKLAHATVRAAVAEARRLLPKLALFAGGKSFGGRMTSQAQAAAPLEGLKGLIFLGFPLHPPGQPSQERAQHLFDLQIPQLFLQGTRDEFARLDLLEGQVRQLGPRATLRLLDEANHSFHVPARTGRTDAQVLTEMLAAMAAWIDQVLSQP